VAEHRPEDIERQSPCLQPSPSFAPSCVKQNYDVKTGVSTWRCDPWQRTVCPALEAG
jgi:hypothetical protein